MDEKQLEIPSENGVCNPVIASASVGNEGTEVATNLASGEQDSVKGKKFGTFNGVFRPTILTILGVMMYLREGWVVGNAGLGGALLIILMTYAITGTAALSISSITTNIRLGSGGVFSIVSQSLGLEVGGSIGIPFYLAQGLSTAMYIYGFMEGWIYIFPEHPPIVVLLTIFTIVFILSYLNTSLAFYVQVVVMFGVILALGSIYLGLTKMPEFHKPEIWGSFEQMPYWGLFAVFFPAATGIMVGASMSGNLKTPRFSIPAGTLAAWGLSLVVYLSLAVWYALVAEPTELRNQLTIAVDKALWGPAVLIGILSSCFTAALSSFVAAPRILQSLGSHQILPYFQFFSHLRKDEPRNAIVVTGGLVLVTLFLGDLNTIAQVLTVIFLLTYFTINIVLLIEQRLNLISFRPTFRIPFWVPLCGSLFCLSAILIISPFLGLVALLISLGIYIYLGRSSLKYPIETVRSGLFLGIANWAAKKVATSSEKATIRSWKPDLLIPIERKSQMEGFFRFLYSLVYPQGSIQVVALMKDHDIVPLLDLKQLIQEMQGEGVFASSAIINSSDYIRSLDTAVTIKKGSFFQPNIIFSAIEGRTKDELQGIINIGKKNEMGVLLYAQHPETGLGRGRKINLWIRDQSPHWHLDFDLSHVDLSLLIAHKLLENWSVELCIICVVSQSEDIEPANKYLNDLMDLARMTRHFKIVVEQGQFTDFLRKGPRADLNILGLAETINKECLQKTMIATKHSCLFVKGSGLESALA